MRLEPKKALPQSKRHGKGRPITAIIPSVVIPQRKPTSSWWTDYADPSKPRELFVTAAQQRDRELQFDPVWKKPEKLGQIGQP